MRSTSLLLLASTALTAHASLLFPRQDSSSSSSLDSVYSSLESFSQEVATKIGQGECVESDSCAGWLNGALECISGQDELTMAKCACDGGLKARFDTCVTCVGSDSATQTGQAFNQVCTSLTDGSLSSSSDSNESATSSAASETGASSSSGSATSAPPSSSTAAGSSAAQPSASADQGSGAGKVGASFVGGLVGAGLVGMLM